MLQELNNKTKSESIPINAGSQNNIRTEITWGLSLAIIIFLLALFWFSFDHHFPAQDEAEHIMNSMSFKDLLAHCRPWHQCLTVNGFYPPFIYFVNGSFLLIFGQSRFVEQLTMSFFCGLLAASIYTICRLLNGTRAAACVSALCFCAYPVIYTLGHTFLLDLPAIAMTAFALMTLLWWRDNPNPDWQRTLLTGLTVACACMSKQLVATYLLPVGFYYLLTDLISLKQSNNTQTSKWIIHTLGIGKIVVLIVLPFILFNHQYLTGMSQSFLDAIAFKRVHYSYLEKLFSSVALLPSQMSPFLLIIFVLSLFFTSARNHIKFLPLTLSALGGFALTCISPWSGLLSDQRYTASSLIVAAIYSGFFIAQLISSEKRWQRVVGMLVILFATTNYLFFNFVPYPLPLPTLPWQTQILDSQTAISDKQVSIADRETIISHHNCNPVPLTDWGQILVLDTIEKVDNKEPVYLNILVNSTKLNPHTFELLLKERDNKTITATTSRSWTIIGDQVKFTPETVLYYHWYLLKTGSTGYGFYDKESAQNFKQLTDFISHSDKYKLVLENNLPDKSKLILYRRTY